MTRTDMVPTMQVYWPKFGPVPVVLNVTAFDPAVHTRWEEFVAEQPGPASVGEPLAGGHAITPDAPAVRKRGRQK